MNSVLRFHIFTAMRHVRKNELKKAIPYFVAIDRLATTPEERLLLTGCMGISYFRARNARVAKNLFSEILYSTNPLGKRVARRYMEKLSDLEFDPLTLMKKNEDGLAFRSFRPSEDFRHYLYVLLENTVCPTTGKRGMPQSDLARELGLSKTHLSDMLRKRGLKNILARNLARIVEVLHEHGISKEQTDRLIELATECAGKEA